MWKKIIFAGLLAASSHAIHAERQAWSFSYTGFYDSDTARFRPDLKITGKFLGEDLDHNGELTKNELLSFSIFHLDYSACKKITNPNFFCSLDSFSYRDGSKLNFTAGWSAEDPEGFILRSHSINSGQNAIWTRSDPHEIVSREWTWTQQTQFLISSAPVPEPDMYAMFGLGLLGMTALQRRRRAPA